MKNKLMSASIGITIVMVFGYILSFVREALIAKYYGISYMVDAYSIAIQVPVQLFSFISVAVQSVVVPIYSELYYSSGKFVAKKYVDHLLSLLFIITLLLVIIGTFFSGGLVYLFAPGFDQQTHMLSTELLRIVLPTIIFSILSQVLVAVLNVHKQFVLPSFAVYFMNIGIILCIVFFHIEYGIQAACYGQLIGDLFRLLFLFLIANKVYHYSWSFDIRDQFVIQTMKKSIPVMWSIGVAEVNAIVNRMVCSFLFVGSIAAISYAQKLNSVLFQFFVTAITTIAYPMFAESMSKGNTNQLNNRVNSTLSLYTLLVVPLMVGILVFREELVELAFGRGAFDADAVSITKDLFGLYAIGILFMAFRNTLTNVFYTVKNTKTPSLNATFGAILNIILNLTLPLIIGIYGIVVSTTVTSIFISIRLLILMKKKIQGIDYKSYSKDILGIIISSIVMGILIFIYKNVISDMNTIWLVLLGTLIGSGCYMLSLFILRVPIFKMMLKLILNK